MKTTETESMKISSLALSGGIPDPPGEISDHHHNPVSQILHLFQLPQRHRMSQMYVRRTGWSLRPQQRWPECWRGMIFKIASGTMSPSAYMNF